MKKIIVFIFIFLLIPLNVQANEKVKVKFKSCVDGDTANFILKNEQIKVRFLAIDTPELSSSDETVKYYANKAKDFTCNKLKNANKIELEFDDNSNKTDKYGRYLAWIFYDDKLLQLQLIKNGYAKVDYLYGDYAYTDKLIKSEKIAKEKKIGIHSNEDVKYATNIEKIKKSINKFIDKLSADISKFISEILDEFF